MKKVITFLFSLALFLCCSVSIGLAADTTIYRVYHPGNGEHLYTSDANEAKTLVRQGWNDEGIGWTAPENGKAVYRLYNAGLQNHLYTTDTNEVAELTTKHGWTKDYDGKPLFYSGGSKPIYRVYNKELRGMHHLTTDQNEYNTLPKHGWEQEGVALYALSESDNTPTPTQGKVTEFQKDLSSLLKKYPVKSGATGEYATERLIIRLKSGTIDPTSYGAIEYIQDKTDPTLYIAQFSNQEDSKNALNKIQKLSNVKYVEPDRIESISGVELLPMATNTANSWGVSHIGADKLSGSLNTNSQITVAVVDTGVSDHSFIGSRKLTTGYDFIDEDTDPSDPEYESHGTHVAGIIVDSTPDLNVKILPVRVMTGQGGPTSAIAKGIEYAANNGAQVINLSLGGAHSELKDEEIEKALKKDIVVCVAAGNEHQDTSALCPAHIEEGIVVGAIDQNNVIADFSNYGQSVDVVAPGVNIVSTISDQDYAILSGTSMATPYVSASAALLKLKYPGANHNEIEQMLKESATDLGQPGWDSVYGHGVVNLSSFVEEDLENPDDENNDNLDQDQDTIEDENPGNSNDNPQDNDNQDNNDQNNNDQDNNVEEDQTPGQIILKLIFSGNVPSGWGGKPELYNSDFLLRYECQDPNCPYLPYTPPEHYHTYDKYYDTYKSNGSGEIILNKNEIPAGKYFIFNSPKYYYGSQFELTEDDLKGPGTLQIDLNFYFSVN